MHGLELSSESLVSSFEVHFDAKRQLKESHALDEMELLRMFQNLSMQTDSPAMPRTSIGKTKHRVMVPGTSATRVRILEHTPNKAKLLRSY